MKKLLIFITALFLLVSVEGQILRYSNYTAPIPPPSGGGITDDFESYTAGGLSGQGNWLNCRGGFNVADTAGNNIISPNYYLNNACIMRTETFSADQYSEVEIIGEFGNSGVAVRCQDAGNSTAEYYAFYALSATRRVLSRVVNGSYTALIDKTGASEAGAGSTIRLEIKADTLRCYINGNLDTSLNGTGIYIDSTIASGGTPGVHGYGNSGTNTLDNFSCGDL